MHCETFLPRDHFKYVNEWLKARDLTIPNLEDIPKIGLIAWEDDMPVSIVFLRLVEGGFSQIDGLVTNPSATSDIRNKANDYIVVQLIEIAKQLGIKGISCYSKDENTLIRSQKFGFKSIPHTVIVRSLRE